MDPRDDAAPAAPGQSDAEIVSVVRRFELIVEEACRAAYVQLFRLGLDDARIVALLGLPDEMPHLAGTSVSEAA